jgi:hypothetical protein
MTRRFFEWTGAKYSPDLSETPILSAGTLYLSLIYLRHGHQPGFLEKIVFDWTHLLLQNREIQYTK